MKGTHNVPSKVSYCLSSSFSLHVRQKLSDSVSLQTNDNMETEKNPQKTELNFFMQTWTLLYFIEE